MFILWLVQHYPQEKEKISYLHKCVLNDNCSRAHMQLKTCLIKGRELPLFIKHSLNLPLEHLLMKVFCSSVIILLLFFFHAHSQSFSLSFPDGTSVGNGDTIVVVGIETDLELTACVRITNNSSSPKTVTVKKLGLSIVTGSASAFAFGQNEYAPGVTVAPGNHIAAATEDSLLAYYFPQALSGVSFIQYTFFDEDNPADSAWVIVEYQVNKISGIAGTNSSSIVAFPNPVYSTVNISLPESGAGTIQVHIFNSNGIIVYAAFLRHQQSIDVSELPSGYYTIEAGGVRWKLIKQ